MKRARACVLPPRYDLLCDLFSLGIHRIWKRQMAGRIAAARWDNMFDVAAGTGDIPLRVIRQQWQKQKLSVDLASISLAERFKFAPKFLVRSCAIAVQGNDVSHPRKQCPYEATTSTWK